MDLITLIRFTGMWVAARLDLKSDRGATAVEYGVMVALIAVGIILAVTFLRDELRALFSDVTNRIKAR